MGRRVTWWGAGRTVPRLTKGTSEGRKREVRDHNAPSCYKWPASFGVIFQSDHYLSPESIPFLFSLHPLWSTVKEPQILLLAFPETYQRKPSNNTLLILATFHFAEVYFDPACWKDVNLGRQRRWQLRWRSRAVGMALGGRGAAAGGAGHQQQDRDGDDCRLDTSVMACLTFTMCYGHICLLSKTMRSIRFHAFVDTESLNTHTKKNTF